jgi:hypothetical protein
MTARDRNRTARENLFMHLLLLACRLHYRLSEDEWMNNENLFPLSITRDYGAEPEKWGSATKATVRALTTLPAWPSGEAL